MCVKTRETNIALTNSPLNSATNKQQKHITPQYLNSANIISQYFNISKYLNSSINKQANLKIFYLNISTKQI